MECKVRDISMHYEEVGTGRPLLVRDGWVWGAKIMSGSFAFAVIVTLTEVESRWLTGPQRPSFAAEGL